LIIFDLLIDESEPSPISPLFAFNQKVHLCGFAKIDSNTFFCVPGEVQSVEVSYFLISCILIPGLSGCAAVCDSTGKIIRYCKDAQNFSFFGAYIFPASYIITVLNTSGFSKGLVIFNI
jgi:hypothetical protein